MGNGWHSFFVEAQGKEKGRERERERERGRERETGERRTAVGKTKAEISKAPRQPGREAAENLTHPRPQPAW